MKEMRRRRERHMKREMKGGGKIRRDCLCIEEKERRDRGQRRKEGRGIVMRKLMKKEMKGGPSKCTATTQSNQIEGEEQE